MRRDDEETIPRFPLAWPSGWTRHGARTYSSFRSKGSGTSRYLSISQAVGRLEDELRLMKARNVTISTNVQLRLDGIPRSDQAEPRDPGAAVYFSFRGKATVFACDKYNRVADNIAAIAKHVEALRAIERFGVGSLEQALAGYKSLPADTAADWRAVFGFKADARPTVEQMEAAFREEARKHHPDRGGTEDRMTQVNRAREFALSELKPTY